MRPGFIDSEVVLQVAVFRLPIGDVEPDMIEATPGQPHPLRRPVEDLARVGEPQLLPLLDSGARPGLREGVTILSGAKHTLRRQ